VFSELTARKKVFMEVKENPEFLRNMHNVVWSYAFKREGHFVSYLAQVALAIGGVAYALSHTDQPYLFAAQVFALIMLSWGATMAISVNYDYRINQAMSWALEHKFGATKEIVPPNFGRPKGDLIEIYYIHLLVFLLIGASIVLVGLYPHKWVFSKCIDFIIILVILVIFMFIIMWYKCRTYGKFNGHFDAKWRNGITLYESKCCK